MKLDELLDLLADYTRKAEAEVNNLWDDTQGYVKLADLTENPYRTLRVKPRRRTYLNRSDVGYDWACGKEFVVIDANSPFSGQVIAIDEAYTLKRYGYDTIQIEYNTSVAPLEMAL